MRVIISPAKKMVVDQDSFSPKGKPEYLQETSEILRKMQNLSYQQAKSLWKTSDKLSRSNYAHLKKIDLTRHLTPAIFSYSGLQYQYMAADILTGPALNYLQQTLRILSGFYGVLRPFDGIVPYRLEMCAKLKLGRSRDLYSFWKDRLYLQISGHGPIINLASKEYSSAVIPYLQEKDEFIDITFAHLINGKLKTRATPAKIARGQMVHFIAEKHITSVGELRNFQSPTYSFSPERSSPTNLVFVNENN